MVKITIFLETEIAVSLRQISLREGRSQAELIRDALSEWKRPAIRGIGEFDSGESGVSGRARAILRKASEKGKWRKQRSRGAHR